MNQSFSISIKYCQLSQTLFLLAVILLLTGCTVNSENRTDDPICGLASPLVFTSDSITFNISDYFSNSGVVEEMGFPDEIDAKQIDSNRYRLYSGDDLPALSTIQFKSKDYHESEILVKNPGKEKVIITFDPEATDYTEVRVRGTMNYWNAQLSDMKLKDGKWIEEFKLTPGEHQYLIVADGREFLDPNNPDSVNNNIGGFNSLIRVGKYKQEDLPFLRTNKIDRDKIHIGSTSELERVYVFWQNRLIESSLEALQITIKIPSSAKSMKRSWIRVFASDIEGGISNDILIPLDYGEVITNADKLNRFDRQTMILYFMMVDRFKNGDPSNDNPVDDPEILPKANYYGGDLAGIRQVITSGYFTELGVNSIWLSPIIQNPEGAYGLFRDPRTRFSAYHGYWPVSYKEIDYRFGTRGEFASLVEEAHINDMNILIDYVASHVHELHPVYQQHPDWATDLYLPDGTLNTEKWDEHRLTTWFDTFLPKLDLRRPDVVNPLTDSALFWIREFGIDGFRHDATKHIDELYWRTLTAKLKELTKCNPMPYQIGETYGSPELISSYVSTGMLDGQFDFNLYDDAVAVFARENESFERLYNGLTQSLRYYGYHNLMGNITGNQDRPRFISLAGGSLHFDEDSKYAGWTREIGIGDPAGYKKLKMLHAFNMTIPGIPVIYYGDEFGMPGANDPDNRRMMRFEGLNEYEKDVKSTLQKLTSLRNSNMALLFGDVKVIEYDKKAFAYIRFYFDTYALVIFNKGTHSKLVSIPLELLYTDDFVTHFGSNVQLGSDSLSISLEALSFEIITNSF